MDLLCRRLRRNPDEEEPATARCCQQVLRSFRQNDCISGDVQNAIWEGEILKDEEDLQWDAIELPDDVEYLKDIDVDDDTNLNKIFFDHFFPSVKGHAKTLDKYHASTSSPMYKTVKDDKIVFYDDNNDDPDWMVKKGYTLMCNMRLSKSKR